MRKGTISTKSNKVYSPNNLEVTGDKLQLLVPQKPTNKKVFTKKTLKIDTPEEEELYTIHKPCQLHTNPPQKQPVKYTYKQFLKTPVTEYKNTEISNKVLRQIRETSKVEDFERILQSLIRSENFLCSSGGYIRKNKRDKVLEAIEAEDIYEEFFGQHFEYLLGLVQRASEEKTQN